MGLTFIEKVQIYPAQLEISMQQRNLFTSFRYQGKCVSQKLVAAGVLQVPVLSFTAKTDDLNFDLEHTCE